jgi:CRP-like cAMP-binding protein
MPMEPSLISRIVDRSIRVEQVETFEEILRDEPHNADLTAAFADFLEARGQADYAARTYDQAACGYLKAGRMLGAMVMMRSKWRIRKPVRNEIGDFLARLRRSTPRPTPFSAFVSGLSARAQFDLLCRLKREHIAARSVLKKAGDPETRLRFIVSGRLKESTFDLIESRRDRACPPVRTLGEEDVCGRVYPFTERHTSASFLEAITPAQTAVLGRECLRALCARHSEMEKALIRLCEVRRKASPSKETRLRESIRYPVQVEMRVRFKGRLNGSPQTEFHGRSKDMSIHGVGFVAENCSKEVRAELARILERKGRVDVEAVITSGGVGISTSGSIVRLQESVEDGVKTTVLGIEFAALPPHLQGMLFSFTRVLSSLPVSEPVPLPDVSVPPASAGVPAVPRHLKPPEIVPFPNQPVAAGVARE